MVAIRGLHVRQKGCRGLRPTSSSWLVRSCWEPRSRRAARRAPLVSRGLHKSATGVRGAPQPSRPAASCPTGGETPRTFKPKIAIQSRPGPLSRSTDGGAVVLRRRLGNGECIEGAGVRSDAAVGRHEELLACYFSNSLRDTLRALSLGEACERTGGRAANAWAIMSWAAVVGWGEARSFTAAFTPWPRF